MSEPAYAAEPAARGEARPRPEAFDSAEAAELARRRQSPGAEDEQQATYRQHAQRRAGVTGRGVVALILVATFVAGLLDMALSGHRGHIFALVFVASSAAGALAVRRRDMPVAMIAPPLAYCVLIGVMSLIDRGGLTGGFRTTVAFYLGDAFVTGAPAIWGGTALACLLGWYRLRRRA